MKYLKRNEILVHSSLFLASFQRRIFSFIIDVVVLMIIFIILLLLLQWFGFNIKNVNASNFTHIDFEAEHLNKNTKFIFQCILTSIPTIYFTLTTFFCHGQTVGKKFLKIRVVSLYHHKIGFWHCLERSLGYVASTLEFGLGFIQALWNHNRMTLHDKIAETIVVKVIKQKKGN